MTELIKCNKCGQVLISGNGCLLFFGKGTSIACNVCGNKYTFGQEDLKIKNSQEIVQK